MSAQFLNNRNNDNMIGSNLDQEENPDTEPPKTQKSKENCTTNASVIKGIQA